MDNINSGDESDHDLISTEMLEDIRDRSHTHQDVNRREARYKIHDSIRLVPAQDGPFSTRALI